jgi:hypothetical protein
MSKKTKKTKDLSTEKLNKNWEFVTWTVPFGIFPTRIIKYKNLNLLGTNIYKIQRKYLFFWKDICTFCGENIH